MESSPPEQQLPELTEAQQETADFFVATCGLQEVADREITMMGASGTVRYGLGRCGDYLGKKTPDEIRDMVMAGLAEQDRRSEQAQQ